jgi:hypothetical protein
MTVRFRRTLTVLVGIAAVAAASLSWVEANNGRQEEQAFVNASRGALDIFVKLAASAPRAQFEGNALRRAVVVQAEGTAGVLATPIRSDLFQASLAKAAADEKAGRRLADIAQAMSEPPDDSSGLDEATLEALQITSPAQVIDLVEQQNAELDDADRYGTRQEHAFFSLGLVATGAALIGLAGLMGASRAGWISLFTSAAALSFAVLWTAIAFV